MLRFHLFRKRDTRYLVDDPGIPTLQEAVSAFEHGGNASLPIHAGGSYDFAGSEPPTLEEIESLETANDEDIMDAAAALYRDKAEAAALRRLEASRVKKTEEKPQENPSVDDNPGGAQ